MRKFLVAIFLFAASSANAQQVAPASKFIRENAPVIAVSHVQLIDGSGAPAQADHTIVMDHGKIVAVGPTAGTAVPAGAKVIDGKGKTLIPGIVGVHEHLFYPAANDGEPIFMEQPFSFPQLYLASGVTTARTTGSIEPYTDMQVKARVDSGRLPGPDLYLTTPYLEGAPSAFLQLHPLKDAAEARAFVDYWHSVGFTSVKAYMSVKSDELRAGIEQAHKFGMKVTGHLCSVGYIEAAETGIDDLEHGPYGAPDGELYSKKKPGVCLDDFSGYFGMLAEIIKNIDPDGPELRKTTDTLVAHHVAVTSPLADEFGDHEEVARIDEPAGVVKSDDLASQYAGSRSIDSDVASEGDEIRAQLRRGRRNAAGRLRSDRHRANAGRLGRSATSGTSRRGGLHAGRSDSHRHAKWRDVPRRCGPNWERGTRQAGGSGTTRWRPRERHHGNRKPGDRFQERRGLRLKRDLRKPPRAGWTAVTD